MAGAIESPQKMGHNQSHKADGSARADGGGGGKRTCSQHQKLCGSKIQSQGLGSGFAASQKIQIPRTQAQQEDGKQGDWQDEVYEIQILIK